MPFGGLGGGGVKGPRSNNMPRAPRNVNPALTSSRTVLGDLGLLAFALDYIFTWSDFESVFAIFRDSCKDRDLRKAFCGQLPGEPKYLILHEVHQIIR